MLVNSYFVMNIRWFYRASACYAGRERYCFTNSIHLLICPMPVLCLN